MSTVAAGDTGMQTGYETLGRTIGFELFDRYQVEDIARTAARRAITKLAARPAPSGTLPVVIGPGGGGVLFHEACGHGLEDDLVDKGASVFKGRLGEQVASPLVTLVDDGTMAEEWGCYAIDDEGTPAQRNVLIQDGVLTDYMWDHLRSRKEGRPRSGNGRRQSYQHLPMVRMTNTYLVAGDGDPDDIVSSTDHGVYVTSLGGGQVNTATGDFVFGMTEAYLIEDGEITEPIREGNLIGNGPEVLVDIDAVGNDFAMGHPGTCGKDGQGVPVGDGVPTLRVKALTVGGTAAMSEPKRANPRTVRFSPRAAIARWRRRRRADDGDLLDVADAVVAQAHGDEQVEAYVGRSTDTQVRVYEGEVEQLAVGRLARASACASSTTGRQGFAYGGTFDPEVLAETVTEARDNAAFGEPDEAAGLAEPDGVEPADLDLWRPGLAEVPTDRKVALAVELERALLAADPRIIGVESCDYGDSLGETAVVTTTGIRRSARATGCELVAYSLAGDDDETQTGFGFSLGRDFDELDVDAAAGDAAERALRMLGATKPPSGRLTVVLDPWVTAQFLGIVAGTLGGRGGAQGALAVRRPRGRGGGGAVRHAGRGSHRRPVVGCLAGRRRGVGHPARCRSSTAACCGGFVHSTWTARRMGTRSTGSAVRAGFKSTPTAGCRAVALAPGDRDAAALLADVGDGVLVQEVSGLHSGVNPISGTSRPEPRACASGAARWPSRCASSPSPRRSSACCTTWWPSAPTSRGCR